MIVLYERKKEDTVRVRAFLSCDSEKEQGDLFGSFMLPARV
jgi:hypothetical protein